MMGSELNSFLEVINSCISGNCVIKCSEAKSNITNIARYFKDERARTELGKYRMCVKPITN
jgi:hypothetical protein